ncbi:MAG: glycosyl transferase family 1 [Porticoccaceae bacterium]|nr:glycosyl transferase family 1 [Porticoccaceae bacterium]
MQILFVHQNFPGQYRYLARHFGADPAWQTWAIGEKANVLRQGPYVPREGVRLLGYEMPPSTERRNPGAEYERQLTRAQRVAALAIRQRQRGLDPDVICSHPGWGDSLYLKEVFPRARFLSYFEYYARPDGPIVDFDPEFPVSIGGRMHYRSRNGLNLLTLEMADAGVCPTRWQWSTFPEEFRSKIRIIHDGIDTAVVAPSTGTRVTLEGRTGPLSLDERDEVITYSVRNLEPNRGFHVFMRALPLLQRRRPRAITLIVGGDEISYGSGHRSGKTWREVMLEEVGGDLDLDRVLFLGKVPYARLLDLFRITSLHVYLTSPFVLSWSMLEAMSCGAPVLASATPPVTEIIEEGNNGFLFDFHDPEGLAARADELLAHSELRRVVGAAARDFIVEHYDLTRRCLPAHKALIEELVAR